MSLFATTPNSVTTLLKDTYDLIRKRDDWAQGAFAFDKNGKPVSHNKERAICFCLVGALRRSADRKRLPADASATAIHLIHEEAVKLDKETELKGFTKLQPANLTSFNDRNSHRTVKKALRRAIRKSKKL